ncbi:hypothetical protein [Polaromonas jejuensis]|uniref:hypothetical protein n=1 Tax=Polaromonas jejuensis TaxID=457502 RepID=UPI00367080D2
MRKSDFPKKANSGRRVSLNPDSGLARNKTRARSKRFKKTLTAMWDALNDAGFGGPPAAIPAIPRPGGPTPLCGCAAELALLLERARHETKKHDAESVRKIIKSALDKNAAEWSRLLIRAKVLVPEQSVSLTAARPPERRD